MTQKVTAIRSPRLRTYRVFVAMHHRCENPKSPGYGNYGGRGIHVSPRWASFETFLADMGFQPEGLTLERENNNGNYEPNNCKWVTRTENARNTRKNRFVTLDGETRCIAEWAELTGLRKETIIGRLNRGWPAELALKAPNTVRAAPQMLKALKPLEKYLEKTKDYTPIYYLIEKFLGDKQSDEDEDDDELKRQIEDLLAKVSSRKKRRRAA
jgi:hypothetical protein